MSANESTVTVTIQDPLDGPPTPAVLCGLAQTFDDAGYAKLARYLRACGDALSAKAPAVAEAAPAAPIATGLVFGMFARSPIAPLGPVFPGLDANLVLLQIDDAGYRRIRDGHEYELRAAPAMTRAEEAAQANERG